MVVGSLSQELKSSLPASRLWKALVVDSHKLLPKIAPQFISNMEIIEGDGGAGSIVVTTFAEAIKGVKTVKTRTEVMDEASLWYKYTILEGNLSIYEAASYEYKFEVLGDGGSLCKISYEYKTVGDVEPSEEGKRAGIDAVVQSFKGIEAYLMAIPDAYV